MNTIARSLLLLPLLNACFVADVAALQAHMIGDCGVAPIAPTCAFQEGNEASARRAFARFTSRSITSAETEACILAVDCSEERRAVEDPTDDLLQCLSADPGLGTDDFGLKRGNIDEACGQACDFALEECGGECGPDAVTACFGEHEACRAACPIVDG
jgi:hypothetical protein